MRPASEKTYATRDEVMKLLSDVEIARVSTAETELQLADGDEYLDLEQLEKGVLRASGKPTKTTPMGRVLPKKAVEQATWKAVLAKLPASRAG